MRMLPSWELYCCPAPLLLPPALPVKETETADPQKHTLFRRALTYFLLQQLIEALHVFDKKKVWRLLPAINWADADAQLRRKVLAMLNRHAGLFVRNIFHRQ